MHEILVSHPDQPRDRAGQDEDEWMEQELEKQAGPVPDTGEIPEMEPSEEEERTAKEENSKVQAYMDTFDHYACAFNALRRKEETDMTYRLLQKCMATMLGMSPDEFLAWSEPFSGEELISRVQQERANLLAAGQALSETCRMQAQTVSAMQKSLTDMTAEARAGRVAAAAFSDLAVWFGKRIAGYSDVTVAMKEYVASLERANSDMAGKFNRAYEALSEQQ